MSPSAKASSKRSTFLRLAGTLVAFGLLVYLLSQQGWTEILIAIRQIEPWRLILAMLLMIVSRFATSARWHVLLRSAGMKISYGQSTRITFAGLFASNFLPTTIGGDVVRLAGAIQLKFDAAISAASLIVDRLVGMAGMALAVPLCLPVLLNDANQHTGFINHGLTNKPLTMVFALSLGKWLQWIWKKLLKIGRKVFEALALWLKQPRSLAASLGFTWVNMLCLFSILQLFLAGMGEDTSVWVIGGLYSLVYFITLIPISINGYGLQEISMTLIFAKLGGVSMSSSLTAALLFRTFMMLASLPGAFILPGLLSAREQAEREASGI